MIQIARMCFLAVVVIAAPAGAATPSPDSLSEQADVRYDEPTGRSCVLSDVATDTRTRHVECKPPKSWAERRAATVAR
jgi:hypothetical protein